MSEAAKTTSRAADKLAADVEKVLAAPKAAAEDVLEKVGAAFSGPAVQGLLASQQKNLETLLQAQTVLFDGANAVFKRQLEIMQRVADQTLKSGTELIQPGTLQAGSVEKHVDAARKMMEQLLADTQELGTLIGKSQQEAVDLLNKRILANLDELKTTFSKSA